MIAVNLKTEYLRNPVGIDIPNPRLFWNCQGGVTQTAYRILCRDEAGELLWDSGRRDGSTMCVPYAGKPLTSRSRVLWQVMLWDEADEAGDWSEEAYFELGLLSARDWKATWITGNYKVNKKRRYPVDCFRKVFSTGNAKKARLYITACGEYAAKLDGQKIGTFVLAPGYTDYRKRVQYQTYDLSVSPGAHTLTVQLSDGWYRGSCGAWGLKNQYGTQTKLLAQLELTMADGSVQTIATDGSWDWSNDGPIRFADNQDGEIVDGAKLPGYSGKAKETRHGDVCLPQAQRNPLQRQCVPFDGRSSEGMGL